MTIRQATPKDFDAIYSLVKTAFQTAKVSDGGEQDFVLKLRKGSYIPELELVAEEDGVLIGHIMLTGASIRENGGCIGTLILAPLSEALDWRAIRAPRIAGRGAACRSSLRFHGWMLRSA